MMEETEEFFSVLSKANASNRSIEIQGYLLNLFQQVSKHTRREFIIAGLDVELHLIK